MTGSLSSRRAPPAAVPATQHRATRLFLKIVHAYHIRQYIFPHLTATEVSRLIHATDIDRFIGRHERAKVLNPMRNLFTDYELDQISIHLAADASNHVIVVGRDLEDLYARVENPEKLDSGIQLQISIVELKTHGVPYNSNSSTIVGGNLVSHGGRAESTTDLPGRWLWGPQETRVGIFNTGRSEISEEKCDVRDKRIRLRRRRVKYCVDPRGARNLFENLTNKGFMTLLKGNIQQQLGKTNRFPFVAGPDSLGLTATVLDNMVYVDMRDPVMKAAVNSGRTRRESASRTQVKGFHIAVPLEHEKDCWYIPLGPVSVVCPSE